MTARVQGLSEEKVNVALSLLQDQRHIEWAGQTARVLTNKSVDALRLDFSFLEKRQEADYRRLGEMLDYLATEECRRAAILRYFGERVPVGHNCGACDVCHALRPSSRPSSGILDVRPLILAAVRDLQKRGLGRSGLAQVLAGSQSRRLKQLKLDTSPHYGKLARLTQDQIIEQIDSLISSGILRLTPGSYPAVVLAKTPTGSTPAREPAQAPQEKIPAAPAAQTRPTLDQAKVPMPTPNSEPRTPNS
jgi:superfamily II DNA helicase RecQ